MHWHLGLQHLAQMPTDSFTLAVFIRRQIKVIRFFQSFSQFGYLLFLVTRHYVDWREVRIDVHSQVCPLLPFVFLGDFFGPVGQITNVTNTRLDCVAFAEELTDRPCFGW